MPDEKKSPHQLSQDKDQKSGPLAKGVKKDAGEKSYIENAAAALDDPEAEERGLEE